MKEFLSLRLLDRFSKIFEQLGCDYPLLRDILQVKLTMDTRRVPTIMRNARRKKPLDEDSNRFVRSLWLYAFLGLVLIPFVLMNQTYLFQMSTSFAILMFLAMMSMISDFAAVLLDVRDISIIATKPVPARTLSFARAIHVTMYLSMLTGTLAAPGLIVALLRHGFVFFLLFVLMIILMDMFVLVFTALLYLVILNAFDGERLKDIINYVQIALSIVMIVGYQLVGRSFALLNRHIAFHTAWWQVVVPPIWFGAAFTWLQSGHQGGEIVVLSILSVLVPTALLGLYIRLLPTFERRLEKLANSAKQRERQSRLIPFVSRLLCRSQEEQTFFQFSSWMMGKERDFKLKVYPSVGLALVFPFIFLLNPAFSGGGHSLASGKAYLFIYAISLVVPTFLMMLKHSSQYKAAWIYEVTPVERLSSVYRGTVKAALVRLFLPIYLIDGVVFTLIFGWRVVPQLVIVGLSIGVYTVISFHFLEKGLPFSRPFETTPAADRYIVPILILLILIFVAVHFVSTLIPFGVYVYAGILILLNALVWSGGMERRGRRIWTP
ncbi:hypothetical protein [Alicyclobacillus sp. ALC3]|uniref:hypothetical protein n=1 Tax=Alicyclobacillus sp. ALC3 TaxID=2796143 RepID=UPI0023784640|nr:hypothetical protein [Alicyclobacillus sp. ALC3]WDL98354.1 hypothetical protein JC200_06615 [Alicyclobacillus sp. ALC3]